VTVSLSPAEVVPQVLRCGVQDDSTVERRWIFERYVKELWPKKDVRGREKAGHVCHQLGSPPLVHLRVPSEDKAELVALAVPDADFFELVHHSSGSLHHQVEGTFVIGLGEVMFFRELVETLAIDAHHDPRVEQTLVVRLKGSDVLKLAVCHR